jgi:hypothetical protein
LRASGVLGHWIRVRRVDFASSESKQQIRPQNCTAQPKLAAKDDAPRQQAGLFANKLCPLRGSRNHRMVVRGPQSSYSARIVSQDPRHERTGCKELLSAVVNDNKLETQMSLAVAGILLSHNPKATWCLGPLPGTTPFRTIEQHLTTLRIRDHDIRL